jgi:glycosyltransferase involved in cell wall biosynthesis
MKVAIVHYWLVGMRGGEKVIETLCRIYPEADIFTHVYVPDAVSNVIRSHRVITTFINKLPRAPRFYKNYLPLMPMALEQIDLRPYDLIISSEAGPAKGIVPPPNSFHVCYCHSPMRYIWNMYHEYRESTGIVKRAAMLPIAHYLRTWDAVSANRVDQYIANSRNVASRIHRYYGRSAEVIPPPVDVDAFEVLDESAVGDFYLMVGELVPYKRPELAVQAFNQMKIPLVVIGGGELLQHIRKIAGPTVKVLGPQPFETLRYYYARCRALIFPGEEDFGIVPVEAMASGRPVIAYGRGGALETVIPGLSGVHFSTQSVDAIVEAERECRSTRFYPHKIVAHARAFRAERFVARFSAYVDGAMGKRFTGTERSYWDSSERKLA